MRMKTAVELVRNQDRARLQRMQQRVDQSEPTLCSLRFSSERNGNARGAVSLMIELDRKSRPLKGVVDRALYPSRFCHPLKEVLEDRLRLFAQAAPNRTGVDNSQIREPEQLADPRAGTCVAHSSGR